MGLIGQSPMAQQMQGAIMSHISEHLAFAYRNKVQEQLGVELTPPDAELSEQMEVQISGLIAQAAQQLLQTNVSQAQQQQAQQKAQDPMLQLQQEEIKLRAQELQRKEQDSQRDYQVAMQKLELEQKRLSIEAQKESARLNAQERNNDKKLKTDMLKHMTKQVKPPQRPK
jgi:hypothetical protein